ncbi:MAG: MaoC family dehydratase [Caldilineaceae bacterium]|nr:MaoC family dehydratase [Caldilineaceae bacterium]
MPPIHHTFDTLAPGDEIDLGSRQVTETEIIAFARDFDPQPFHIDPDAADASIFGGIIASGWHTCALTMRLLVDGFLSHATSMGSPGVEQIRWLRPVRPGDTLTARIRVLEKRPSQSKPDRGSIKSLTEVTNQAGDLVMTMESFVLMARSPAQP